MCNRFLWLVTLILLAAAFLRLSQLAEYPPGPHYDEAANILITRSIAFDGANLFPIANSYQGRESLYYYLNIPMFRLVGDDVFALRLSSVFFNLLTIASGIGLARLMFPGRRGRVMALAVGVMMAISFHQIFMSRQAYRAVTLPMMQGLGLLFLWCGLRVDVPSQRDSRDPTELHVTVGTSDDMSVFSVTTGRGFRGGVKWLILAGVFSGGAIYTYMASRLFPLWLGIAAIGLLLLDRARWRLRLRQGVVFFGAMLLVMLPMLLYALDNPEIFFQRLSEVSDGAVRVTLGESIIRHLKMFFIRGDFGNLRYNIPGRPYFTPIEGLLLLVGIGAALRNLFSRRDTPLNRTRNLLLLLSPLMVIPSVISVAGYPPSHMRSLGMVPLIFLLVALGFDTVWRWIMRRMPGLDQAWLLTGVVVLALFVGGATVYNDYMDWARRVDLFEQADGDLALAAEWLDEHVEPGTPVYIASYHREHPTVIAGWDGTITWLGSDSLILSPEGQAGIVIFSRTVQPDVWQPFLQSAELLEVPTAPDGLPAFVAYRITGNALNQDETLTIQNNLLQFYSLQTAATPSGETAQMTMAWRVLETPPYYRLRPVVRLESETGEVLATEDLFLLGTSAWRPGETIYQQVRLAVPDALPPGDYPLKVAWVDRDTDTYLTYHDAAGDYAGTFAPVGDLHVIRPATFADPQSLPIDHRVNETFADGVMLLGWNTPPRAARPGEMIVPLTYWQATPTQSGRGRQSIMAQAILRQAGSDTAIWQGTLPYPSNRWIDDEVSRIRFNWRIPRELASGSYELLLTTSEHEIALGELEIAGEPRVYEPPPVDEILNYRLGDSLLLYGYTIFEDDSGISLELAWSALEPVETDYTVFVHVLDVNDVTLTQRDQMPRNYSYPTSLWDAGEYVTDNYHFDIHPDQVDHFRVGLYIQATGDRLPVYFSIDAAISDDNFIIIYSY